MAKEAELLAGGAEPLPEGKLDWSCVACMTVNELSASKCVLCDQKPNSSRNVKCKYGHELRETPKLRYSNPACDGIGCGKKSLSTDGHFYTCQGCDFNLCSTCRRKLVKKLAERPFECRLSHPLVRLGENIFQQQNFSYLEKKASKTASTEEAMDTKAFDGSAANPEPEAVDDEDEDAIYNDDDEDLPSIPAGIPDDLETKKNEAAAELYFIKFSPVGPVEAPIVPIVNTDVGMLV